GRPVRCHRDRRDPDAANLDVDRRGEAGGGRAGRARPRPAGTDRGPGPRAALRAARHRPRPPAASGRRRMTGWDPEADRRRLECLRIGAAEVRAGDRVRLRPRGRADILDLALAGKTATVEAIEQDFDGRAYLAVIVDDDPGRDLGALRQPGHRFFFSPE